MGNLSLNDFKIVSQKGDKFKLKLANTYKARDIECFDKK